MTGSSGVKEMEKGVTAMFNSAPKAFLVLLSLLVSVSCLYRRYDGLMSWEEYRHLPRGDNYILEVDSEKGALLYYGSFHRVDPSDPQFEDIERKWNAFRPTVAYCEGNIWPLMESREEAIRNYGEQGLLRYLAGRDGVPIRCLDRSILQQAQYLRNYFMAEEVCLYFVLRQSSIHQMMKKDSSDLSYVDNFLSGFAVQYYMRGTPRNLHEFKSTVSRLLPGLENWENVPSSYFYRPEKGRFLAEIHFRLNEFRDHYMLTLLLDELKKGQRVFAVVGRSHVVKQEAVLRSATT